MERSPLVYKIAISLIPGVGTVTAKKLIAYAGSIEAVFNEPASKLEKIPGVGTFLAKKVTTPGIIEKAEKEFGYIQKKNIKALYYLDEDYPERLKHCPDAPIILFLQGNLNLNHKKVISIVGTRKATERGKDLCNKLVSDLAEREHNPVIVSGLAYGIDVCAHKAALKNNLPTAAVLGHGFETLYPASHKSVANEILKEGALVSDFMSYEWAEKNNFVKRNRIIAGLADATIVIESASKGGALITADLANSYNRDVFAFPGRVNDNYSQGCNRLIKSNKAALIEGVRDLEYIMGWDPPGKINKPVQRQLFKELSHEEIKLVEILKKHGDLPIDSICLEAEMPVSKVSPILLNLEFAGIVKSLPGKVYTLVSG